MFAKWKAKIKAAIKEAKDKRKEKQKNKHSAVEETLVAPVQSIDRTSDGLSRPRECPNGFGRDRDAENAHADMQSAPGGTPGTAPAETDGVFLVLLLVLVQMAWGDAGRWIRHQCPARGLMVQQVRGVVLCIEQHCVKWCRSLLLWCGVCVSLSNNGQCAALLLLETNDLDQVCRMLLLPLTACPVPQVPAMQPSVPTASTNHASMQGNPACCTSWTSSR